MFKFIPSFWCFALGLLPFILGAQVVEDSTNTPKNTFCKPQIAGQSNTRLAGYTYEWHSKSDFKTDAFESNVGEKVTYSSLQMQRLFVTVPIILKPRHTLSLGLNSWQQRFFSHSSSYANHQSPASCISNNGLSSVGTQLTYIFSINSKSLVYSQGMVEQNAVSGFGHLFATTNLRYTGAIVYIRKPSNQVLWGVGVSRSYRPGRLIYFPIAVLTLSTKNQKWVAEAQIPAKAQLKYNATPKSSFALGYEMDGHSYDFQQPYSTNENVQLTLRRGDVRFRAQYEQQLYKLAWLAVQAGYKQNNNFSFEYITNGKDIPVYVAGARDFTAKNKLANQLYFGCTLYLTVPQ